MTQPRIADHKTQAQKKDDPQNGQDAGGKNAGKGSQRPTLAVWLALFVAVVLHSPDEIAFKGKIPKTAINER